MEEKIKTRIEELEQAKERYIAEANACSGAIAELIKLLEILEKTNVK